MDDRTLRISVLLAAHVIFLSAGALRIIRGQRGHLLRSQDPWWLQYYPPLVWIPFVITYFFPFVVDLPMPVRLLGLAIAIASAVFAAWAMWSLGKSYGIRMDLFDGHRLVTGGPYRLTRHPMYLGIISFHVGATLAMESLALLAITLLYVIPFTALRIRAEDRVLASGFGDAFRAFAGRVPALVPFTR
ncbi:MAG TPA: isoprenylcysteine carboxylmethyltransferase family protein [Candidatus Limnocylindria bacterium]|nr:isoprenylcysteine carboxylmethyltransferase family protein [Candidatus Limnocylindria bacterium]